MKLPPSIGIGVIQRVQGQQREPDPNATGPKPFLRCPTIYGGPKHDPKATVLTKPQSGPYYFKAGLNDCYGNVDAGAGRSLKILWAITLIN